jgi:tRNA(fMet)-specific endonuclease VapC
VAPVLILETTFLVDLEREALASTTGPAHAFLDDHPDSILAIALITAGELACGPGVSGGEEWSRLVRRFRVFAPDEDTAWRYGQLYRYLRANGLLFGGNDLWIAATALSRGCPVVTRDLGHYQRVPGLDVLGY